jgi:hypothetical protein
MYDPTGEVTWTNIWDNADLGFDDTPTDMAITPNGDIVIIGNSMQSSDPQSNNADIFIIALSPDGDLLWSDHFSGTGYTSSGGFPIDISNAGGLAITASGDILVTGLVTGNDGTELQQMALAKYDPAGTQLWLEVFDNASVFSYSDLGNDVGVDAAGNAYVCGLTSMLTTGSDPAVWKIDGDGDLDWIATYAGPDNNTSEQFDEVLVDADGNSYAFGINSMSRYVMQKHDAAGVEQWTDVLDTVTASITASYSGSDKRLAFDNDGNIILATGMDSRIGVAKFTPAGDLLWTTLHGGDDQFNNEAYHVTVDAVNSIYVAGAISNTGASYDVGLFKLDPNGNELWGVWHNGPTNGVDKGLSMALTADGAIYVGGVAKGYSASNGDYFLAKYMQGPIGIREVARPGMHVFPNPASGMVHVRFTQQLTGLRSMEVRDMQGRTVRVVPVIGPLNGGQVVDLRDLDRGSYVLCAATRDGSMVSHVILQ